MGLNRIRNAAKLRKLAVMVGRPVLAAYSNWFENQNDLLVFVGESDMLAVNTKSQSVELYEEAGLSFTGLGLRKTLGGD
jgi:hypothetical protein